MRICLISVEIFAWGKHGGFGRATRLIGRELVKRGVEVTAIVPRQQGQKPVESLDGMKVLSFKKNSIWSAGELYRQVDADIYHSEEPSLGTYLALRAVPERKHIVTFRDTRDWQDWRIEMSLPSLHPAQVLANYLYEDNWLVKKAVRNVDARFAAAKLLIPKARKKYHLEKAPEFLPTPVAVPDRVEKASEPTICFLSRWDRRKRPEIFFELARQFPNVRFIAAGKSRDKEWDKYLRSKYAQVPNLELMGFVDQFQNDALSNLLGKSWIMVNTAAREGLPNAYIEAAAHRCAILSAVDPDGFASNYGFHASGDNFAEGLETLLKDDRWRTCGKGGYDYVNEVFLCDKAIDQHLEIYNRILSDSTGTDP